MEMHLYVLSTVATNANALMLNHYALSIHSVD